MARTLTRSQIAAAISAEAGLGGPTVVASMAARKGAAVPLYDLPTFFKRRATAREILAAHHISKKMEAEVRRKLAKVHLRQASRTVSQARIVRAARSSGAIAAP